MHVIAAKATCFQEAGKPEFLDYQKQVKANAYAMATALSDLGFHVVSGGTDNHLLLLDLRPSHPEMTGKEAQLALEGANLTLNRNTVPGETRSPFQTSGLRIGTPTVTSRGMKEQEMEIIAEIISAILQNPVLQRFCPKREVACALFKISITILSSFRLIKSHEKNRSTRKGFTLIELLVVITIIGILAGIAFVGFGDVFGTAGRTAARKKLKDRV